MTSKWLAAQKISPQLARHYVQAGWLQRLGWGVYARPSARLDLDASLRLLAEAGHLHHVSGKTALAWSGFQHNVARGPRRITLVRNRQRKLPPWFVQRFPSRATARALFKESADKPLYIGTQPNHPGVPVADPERAVLEMLSDVPSHQDLEEARHLMQGMVSLRLVVLRRLLMACRSVKAVRLFLQLAKALELPFTRKLAGNRFPTGSGSRYVRRLPQGTLILKP